MNHTGNAVSRPSPLSALSRAEWLCLVLVVLAHVMPVCWLLRGSVTDPPDMTPPIAGMLVSGSGETGGGVAKRAGNVAGSGYSGKAMDDKGKTMPAPKPATPKAPTPSRVERALPGRTAVPAPVRQTVPAHDFGAMTDKTTVTGTGASCTSGDGKGSEKGSDTGGSGHGGGRDNGFSVPDGSGFSNPKPPYPTISRRMGEEGLVMLSVYILADGTVGDVSIKKSSGFRRLDESALKTVWRWRYAPAKRHGKPVAIRYAQPIRFSLND